MDEKTAELRDIFLDVADDGTVTESQEQSRGSVAATGDADEERLARTVAEMREKFAFETDRPNSEYAELIERFYDGQADEMVATALSTTPDAVFQARMDLHLVREDDPPGVTVADETLSVIRDRPEPESEALAEETGLGVQTVEQLRAVLEARARSRRVSHRFRTAFEECVTDADLRTRLASDAHRDGLDDATADAEVDVEF